MLVIETADTPEALPGSWPSADSPTVGRFAFGADVPAPSGSPVERWTGRALRDDLEPLPAEYGAALFVGQEPLPGYESEFDDWMSTEHVPALAAVDGCLWAARFEAIEGSPRFYAAYLLTGADVGSSDRWMHAAMTPWRNRMVNYTHRRTRIILRRPDTGELA